jgi:hypothetical protein
MAEVSQLTRAELEKRYVELVARYSALINVHQQIKAENEALKALQTPPRSKQELVN